VSFLRQYLFAVQSFTRVPVTGPLAQWVGTDPALLRASAAHFPGVGWLVGFVACASFALLGLALPDNLYSPLVAAVGCIMATVLVTGGQPESSLARAADGLGGATAARSIEIMKDSHVGSFGALALALTLLAKVSLLAALAAISPVAVLAALLAAHVVSRFWPLMLARAMPYLGERLSAHKPLAHRVEPRGFGIAGAWCIVALVIALFAQGPGFAIVGLLFSGVALLGLRRLFARRLNGFTDECLGAAQQACEVAFYLGAAIGARVG
jgi:adenosylcobinamide-GDP ribazoletransferase